MVLKRLVTVAAVGLGLILPFEQMAGAEDHLSKYLGYSSQENVSQLDLGKKQDLIYRLFQESQAVDQQSASQMPFILRRVLNLIDEASIQYENEARNRMDLDVDMSDSLLAQIYNDSSLKGRVRLAKQNLGDVSSDFVSRVHHFYFLLEINSFLERIESWAQAGKGDDFSEGISAIKARWAERLVVEIGVLEFLVFRSASSNRDRDDLAKAVLDPLLESDNETRYTRALGSALSSVAVTSVSDLKKLVQKYSLELEEPSEAPVVTNAESGSNGRQWSYWFFSGAAIGGVAMGILGPTWGPAVASYFSSLWPQSGVLAQLYKDWGPALVSYMPLFKYVTATFGGGLISLGIMHQLKKKRKKVFFGSSEIGFFTACSEVLERR